MPSSRKPSRLYVKGVVQSFTRSMVNQDSNNNIVRIEGVQDKKASLFYLGKRLVFIYKAKTARNGSLFRTIWGRVSRPHGTTGAVRVKFQRNLPPRALGATVRVMLYPSNV